jgi:uncharacterized protein YlxP (DUF503 family)
VRSEAALGILLVELHFPANRSLKEKRGPLSSLRDIVQQRFRAAFSEVAHHDAWQLAGVLIVVAASSLAQAEERLADIERYVHARDDFVVSRTVVRSVDDVASIWDAEN